MVLRGPSDPLPRTTQRILVTGASGAGKTTLRQTISDVLDLPTVELDSLHHGPGWTKTSQLHGRRRAIRSSARMGHRMAVWAGSATTVAARRHPHLARPRQDARHSPR